MMELMPCASWATVCQVESELEEELRQEEKRLLRLKQVFAANRAEFHEALSAILGIAVAIYNSGQQCVMMQYDLGAAFIFQPAQGNAAMGGGSGCGCDAGASGHSSSHRTGEDCKACNDDQGKREREMDVTAPGSSQS